MTTTTDLVGTWLKDAYAMESGIVENLERQVDLAASDPAVQQGIQRHLEATRRHVDLVGECLEQLGESPSALKAGLASLGGKMQGMMAGMPEDSLVKIALQDYSTEHMEIASYKALVVAANDAGLPHVATTCTSILADEETMAAWLAEQLPLVVRETLAQVAD